ncbi:MAG: YfhO family protein [Bacteroidota bacterium]
MATAKKSQKQQTETPLIPAKFQHPAAVLAILLSLVVFFNEVVFEGKVFVAADNIASKSFQTLVSDAEQQGIFPLWNPYIFCGMPGYASLTVHGERYFDVSAFIINRGSKLFGAIMNSPDVGWGLFYYWILGAGVYFFVHDKLKNKIAALISGLAVMHSTYVIILVIVGHMTKVPVIAFFPWIFMIIERLREKFDLRLSLLLVLLVHFMLLPGHIQMIFYCYFAFGIYYLFFLVWSLIKKEHWQGVIRSGSIFAVATGLAFLMTGDQYLSTLEYSKYSMRGSDPIVPSAEAQAKGATNGGLDYEYATNWSFSPGEVMTFFVPSWYGFGSAVPYQGPETNNTEQRLPLYFGPMPFTDAPQYMGVVIVILAGIGVWRNRKDPFVQYSTIVVFISLLISFGKEMPLVYDLMFNYFPMFNKFRIPSMILILVQIFVPVLAGYGIAAMMNQASDKDNAFLKYFQYSLIVLAALLVLSVIFKELFLSFYEMFVPSQVLAEKFGTNAAIVHKIITGFISSEITAGILLLIAGLGGLYLFIKNKISLTILVAVLVSVVLIDLWRVNFKPMNPQPHRDAQSMFATPSYVSFMQQDTSLYRTIEFENGQPPYNNTLAYWRIQSAYGYQGAKMRQIQDVFDVVGLGNPLLWGLMNVKYILSDRADSNSVLFPVFAGSGKHVLYNRAEMPRAFFVSRYEVAKGLDILNNIKGMKFNPYDVTYVMEDIHAAIDPPQEGASVQYSHYGIQDLELKVHATGSNLVFLSESWYPEGWKAFIDGTETPIYRLNYMFRGVVVPQGDHVVTMEFEPAGFYLGKNLSLWLNILVLGGLGYFAVRFFVQKKRTTTV